MNIIKRLKERVDKETDLTNIAKSLYNFGYLPDDMKCYKIYENQLDSRYNLKDLNFDNMKRKVDDKLKEYNNLDGLDSVQSRGNRDDKVLFLKEIEIIVKNEESVYIINLIVIEQFLRDEIKDRCINTNTINTYKSTIESSFKLIEKYHKATDKSSNINNYEKGVKDAFEAIEDLRCYITKQRDSETTIDDMDDKLIQLLYDMDDYIISLNDNKFKDKYDEAIEVLIFIIIMD